jgi:LmbE family N-acetylglucosaminyl deacetylase
MRVLVIAPHMDDEVLGPGATIARHVDRGDEVVVCVVANRAYGHEYDQALIAREKQACAEAQSHLGYQNLINLELADEKLDAQQIDVIVPIENVVNDVEPEVIYIPHRGDYHQDHRAIADAMRVVCRPYAQTRVDVIRVYETTSSTGYAPNQTDWPFVPNWYADVSKMLDRKIAAMACYEEEGRTYPHPRSLEGIRIHAQSRGMEVGLEAAEAFMSLRSVWR